MYQPGPWTVTKSKKGHSYLNSLGSAQEHTRFVKIYLDRSEPEISEATTNLVAAAPDLLEACESLLNAPHYDHFAVRLNEQEMEAVSRIKLAIDKARGRNLRNQKKHKTK